MRIFKLIGFSCLLLLLSALFADEGHKILLINSNASVEKYKVAQEEFKKSISRPILEINLEEEKWNIQRVQDFLYDEYPDLIYCIGTKAYLIAQKFVSERNIVFSSIINWQRLPVTEKTYGVSNELHPGMQMTMYRYVFPTVKRIGVLYSRSFNREWLRDAARIAKDMGVEIVEKSVHRSKDTIDALKTLLPQIDALWLISDPVVLSDKDVITEVFKACDVNKKPIFSYLEAFVEYGAVLIVSVDDPTLGRQAADIARETLTGRMVAGKVQLPEGSHVILNLEKVTHYGLQYNESALGAVNQIIGQRP
jgi:putative ABC transport system substrate-binding protein